MIISVQVGFNQGDEQGTMNASVDVPEGETTVTAMMPALQKLTSRIVDGVMEGTGQQISCRAGCGACCRQLVPISVFEAEALAGWIRGLPEEQQALLMARFATTVNEIREKGLLDRLETAEWTSKSEATYELSMDFLKAKIACPFLVNESCGIHPIRPLICREYVVISPAENCSAPWEKPVVGVAIPVQLSKALLRLGEKVDDKGWIPLPLLFEWMKSAETPGGAVRGTGQEVIGAVFGELQSKG